MAGCASGCTVFVVPTFLFSSPCPLQGDIIQNEILPGKWDCLVTSYEMCMREKATLRKFVWEYIVIDEAHRIKNENSKLSLVLRELESRNRCVGADNVGYPEASASPPFFFLSSPLLRSFF